MQKKKIVIIGPAYPFRGGNALYVAHVFNQLKNEFDVVIYNYSLLYPSILFPGTTQFDKSAVTMDSVPSRRLVNSINPFNWFRVASLLKKENADLIVFDWWHPFFSFCHFTISSLIKKKYHNKILFITENVVSHESRFFEKALTKIGLMNSSFFLALSNVVESDLKQYFPRKKIFRSELPVYDCYNFNPNFNASAFRSTLGFKESDKVLLFFGYVRKYKGLNILIESMPQILASVPEAKLLVVGEFYEGENDYRELISKLGIYDKVKIINSYVPNEDIGNYYLGADVVVLPYLSATQSGVLNLAYGFNKPVVITDVGGLAENMDHEKTGIIVKPGDAQGLAKGVIRYFELEKTVDFPSNIKAKVSQNVFSNLAATFKNMLSF